MRPLLALAATLLAAAAHAAPSMHAMDYFVGTWQCNGHFPKSGKTIASRMRYVSDLDGRALVKHHDDTSAQAMYHAIETWGLDNKAGVYRAGILDSFGGLRRFSSPGWTGDRLTWTAAPEVTPAQRFVYVREGRDRYRIDWEVNRDGTRFVVGDTLECVRQR